MKVAIGAFLAVSLACPTPNMAGSGRQSDTIEVDDEAHVVGRWLEPQRGRRRGEHGVPQKSSKPSMISSRCKETKHGLQIFRLRREGGSGLYRARFVDRSAGELTDYAYEIKLSPLPNRRTEITITMTASTENAYSVSVNIELRKSIRGLRSFLQDHLRRDNRCIGVSGAFESGWRFTSRSANAYTSPAHASALSGRP